MLLREGAAKVRVTGQSAEEHVPFRRLKQQSADNHPSTCNRQKGFLQSTTRSCASSCGAVLFTSFFMDSNRGSLCGEEDAS